MPISDACGNMIVDIGGGTTDIAVISLGGMVVAKNLRVAGDQMSQDIIQYARDEFKLLLGEKTAEDIKIAIGSAYELREELEASIKGRDLVTGLPKEVIVNDGHIREAIQRSINTIIDAVKDAVEETPPELVADLMQRGIILAGGGSLLRGLDVLIQKSTEIPTRVVDDPLTAVVRGCGIILEDVDNLREILIN